MAKQQHKKKNIKDNKSVEKLKEKHQKLKKEKWTSFQMQKKIITIAKKEQKKIIEAAKDNRAHFLNHINLSIGRHLSDFIK